MPWQLFVALFERREQGLSRDELTTALWSSKPVQPNTLDQHKKRTNALIQCLRIEISADNRGVWSLVGL